MINFLSSTEKQLKWEADGLPLDQTALKNAVLIDQVDFIFVYTVTYISKFIVCYLLLLYLKHVCLYMFLLHPKFVQSII